MWWKQAVDVLAPIPEDLKIEETEERNKEIQRHQLVARRSFLLVQFWCGYKPRKSFDRKKIMSDQEHQTRKRKFHSDAPRTAWESENEPDVTYSETDSRNKRVSSLGGGYKSREQKIMSDQEHQTRKRKFHSDAPRTVWESENEPDVTSSGTDARNQRESR
ncbi:unnamed protein product [Caenorhabditis nigoni]